MKILVVLQNAWYRDGKHRAYEKWLSDLWNSHTGRRLMEMIPEQCAIYPVNSTGTVTDNTQEVPKGDPLYVRAAYRYFKPDIVLACGKLAQETCDLARIEHIVAPHPAWRGLTKNDTSRIRHNLGALRPRYAR